MPFTTEQRDKHNKEKYARYSFRVDKEDDLYFYLEEFMRPKESSLNYLITKLLREYFSQCDFDTMNPESDDKSNDGLNEISKDDDNE